MEREESNVQTPDFQATLKSIDDEIGYEFPIKSAIDLKSCNGGVNAENNNAFTMWAPQLLNKADQVKPTPMAHHATNVHPTCGPTKKSKPNNYPLDLVNVEGPTMYPKSTQATWKRIIRSPDLNNHEVTSRDLAFRREIHNTENPRPAKLQALDANDVSHLSTTVVAIEQPHRRQ